MVWFITTTFIILKKWADFVSLSTTTQMAPYPREVQGNSETIVSDRDPRFRSRFWISLSESMDARLQQRTLAHSQTNGQLESTIQIHERHASSMCAKFWWKLG